MEEREQLENDLLKAQIERERAQQRLAEEQLAEMERRKERREKRPVLAWIVLFWVLFSFIMWTIGTASRRSDDETACWLVYIGVTIVVLYLCAKHIKERKKLKEKETENQEK